jgi:putative nucleotidyltransferase with HDIG domain
MAAGGIPVKNRTNPVEVVLAGLEMQHFMNALKKSKDYIWDLRIGIHTGSVIAGVVGQKKFTYDIWGDTVNTASRMESSGEAGKVNISGTCYHLVQQFFDCEYRGKMPVKYKGDIDMYFVRGLKPEYRGDLEYMGNHNLQVQLQLLRLQDMEEIILQRLETDIPEYLFYHNATHTANVYAQVELLGRSEGIGPEDMLLVRTAALLHDIGYVYQFNDHEIKSVEVAREVLPTYRFTDEQTEKICSLILATRIAHQPENLLEQIIIDANLDHLGRVDFLILSDKLFQEYRTMNIFKSKKEWNEHQINFLKNHEFHTAAARKLREISRKDQIDNIRKFS